MDYKKEIIDHLIEIEGGYKDDPDDSGGETNFGITVRVARLNGYLGPMRNMKRAFAFEVYQRQYWDSISCDDILKLSQKITGEVFDTCVNCGPGRASEFLQRSLNAFNKQGNLYSDIKVDGDIGPATLFALKSYLSSRSEDVLFTALNCLQGSFYIELTEKRQKDESFVYGWLRTRVLLVAE